MARHRFDETWHRLREWTKGQTPSERLAGQILIQEEFRNLDPSHPLGGRDGGKDAIATKNGTNYAMAVYFPRGQKSFAEIRAKFRADLEGATSSKLTGIAFITNQELSLSEREQLKADAGSTNVELYHLERITAILDAPAMKDVRRIFLDIEDESPSTNFGGLGGAAASAGGGGGAALGTNATGGRGGDGGKRITLEGPILDGGHGVEPGAGGGGAGAVGDGAIGGDGGGGGEHVTLTIGPDEIDKVHHIDFRVGEGGKAGAPGEATIINLCAEDGRILRTITAKGGMPGRPAFVPPASRVPTVDDMHAGLKITAIIAANFVSIRNGLVTLVDGGWDRFNADSVPFQIPLPLLIALETGAIEAGTNLQLKIVVRQPDGLQTCEEFHYFTVQDTPIRRFHFVATPNISGTQAGIWRIEVKGGDQTLREFAIEVRTPDTIDRS